MSSTFHLSMAVIDQKQCGIILTETRTKASQDPKENVECSSGRLETSYRNDNKACLREFKLWGIENKCGQLIKYWLLSLLDLYKLCFCLMYCIFMFVCACVNESGIVTIHYLHIKQNQSCIVINWSSAALFSLCLFLVTFEGISS